MDVRRWVIGGPLLELDTRHLEDLVDASEVLGQRCRVVSDDSLTDKGPALRQAAEWSCHFEVVDVHHKREVQLGVVERAAPVGDCDETLREQVLLAVLLPVPPRIGVPVEGPD